MAWQVKISDSATVKDTIKLIIETINGYYDSPSVLRVGRPIADSTNSKRTFIKGVFDYICKNIIYERDSPGHETVTTPGRLLKDGRGDCKKFSVFIGCLFKKAGIPFLLKVVSYDGNTWSHIYVVVPLSRNQYITVDPVNYCQFNQEVQHKRARLYNLKGKEMELSLLGHPNSKNPISSLNANLNQISGANDCSCGLGAIVKLGPTRWKARARRRPGLFLPVAFVSNRTYQERGLAIGSDKAREAKANKVFAWVAKNTRSKFLTNSTRVPGTQTANAEIWSAISAGLKEHYNGITITQHVINGIRQVKASKTSRQGMGSALLAVSTIVAGIVKGLALIWTFFGKIFGGRGEPNKDMIPTTEDIEAIFDVKIDQEEKPEPQSTGAGLPTIAIALTALTLIQ